MCKAQVEADAKVEGDEGREKRPAGLFPCLVMVVELRWVDVLNALMLHAHSLVMGI